MTGSFILTNQFLLSDFHSRRLWRTRLYLAGEGYVHKSFKHLEILGSKHSSNCLASFHVNIILVHFAMERRGSY